MAIGIRHVDKAIAGTRYIIVLLRLQPFGRSARGQDQIHRRGDDAKGSLQVARMARTHRPSCRDNAVVRHLWVSESELDGKVTNTKIGVMQVWQKQDGGWKLLARASWRLPPPA